MRTSRFVTACLCAVLVLGLTGLVYGQAIKKSVVRVKGSNPMSNLIDKLAKLYMSENKDCNIVVSGGGTPLGLEELIAGNAEVAMASRPASPEEAQAAKQKGASLVERLIGWDGVAVIVHPANPVSELSFEQIRKIFYGEFGDWGQVGGKPQAIKIFLVDPTKAGYAAFFHDYVLKKKPVRNDAETRRFFPNVLKEVAKLPDAIGYAPLRMVLGGEGAGSVKAVAVQPKEGSDHVAASMENLDLRSYPLMLPLFLYYSGAAVDKHVKGFVEFCYTKGATVK